MNAVEQVRALVTVGQTIQVEGTYNPKVNGPRLVTKIQRETYRAEVDGKVVWGMFPVRVRDVLSVDDESATFRIPQLGDEHTIMIRKASA